MVQTHEPKMKTKTRGVQDRKVFPSAPPFSNGPEVSKVRVLHAQFQAEQLDFFLPRGDKSPVLTWIQGQGKFRA
jgi:hypothetical protein